MKYLARIFILVLLTLGPPSLPSVTAQSSTVIYSMAWNPDGTILALGGAFDGQRELRLIDVNGQLIYQFAAPFGVAGVSWHPNGTQFASHGSDGTTIRDVQTGAPVVTFAHEGATSDYFTYWNPANYDQIATVAGDVVHIRDASTGQIQTTLDGPGGKPDSVLSVGWSQDGTTLYTVSNDNLIRVWDVAAATLLNEYPFSFGAQSAAMSPDHTRIAIAGEDTIVRIYDTSGTLLTSFGNLPNVPTRGAIRHLAWHPDGTQIAGFDSEGIHVWNVSSGQVVTLPHQTETRYETGFVFSPDGALTYPSGDSIDLVLLAPIADAGEDQTIFISPSPQGRIGPSANVTLDGTGSSDPDGTITSYDWYQNGVLLGSGPTLIRRFVVGQTTVTLVVTDNDGLTSSDEVVITVTQIQS